MAPGTLLLVVKDEKVRLTGVPRYSKTGVHRRQLPLVRKLERAREVWVDSGWQGGDRPARDGRRLFLFIFKNYFYNVYALFFNNQEK